jgi:hypothetical protein
VPAWPPGASRSITSVRRPSEAPYTAAASPAGPPPITTASYSASRGRVCRPSRSASVRRVGRDNSVSSARRTAGRLATAGSSPRQAPPALGASGRTQSCAIWLRARKAAQRAAGRIPAVAADGDLGLGCLRRHALQAADALARQRTELLGDLGRRRGDGEILVRLDAHHARRIGGAIGARKRRREGQRHLAEDRAGQAPAERALDAVELLHHLELSRQHREEGTLSAFVDRELAGAQGDVGRGAHQALELALRQRREQRYGADFLDRQHALVGSPRATRRACREV